MHSNTRSFQRARFEVWIVWKFGFEIHFSGNHVKNHATLWPNLQNSKISSRAEIPKLDRVWQQSFQKRKVCVCVCPFN